MPKLHLTHAALAAAAAAVLTLAACGDDDGGSAADPSEPAATTAATTGPTATISPEAPELALTAVDYGFEGIDGPITAGTRLSLTNSSSVEVHEAVVFRLPEGEERPIGDLVAASEADPAALGEFAGVLVAMPGQDGVEVEGPVVLDQPGRYAVVCFIPVGADPAVYQAAIEAGTPPDVSGPPHATQGMVHELVVE